MLHDTVVTCRLRAGASLVTTAAYQHPLRPLSMLEGTYYDEDEPLTVEVDTHAAARPRPPPPSSKRRVVLAEISPTDIRPVSSSGYHSAGDSKMSSFLAASTPSGSPTSSSLSGPKQGPKSVEESTIFKLRQEIEALKSTFMSSQKRWSEVSSQQFTTHRQTL